LLMQNLLTFYLYILFFCFIKQFLRYYPPRWIRPKLLERRGGFSKKSVGPPSCESLLNWLPNWQLKTSGRWNTLKGSQRMGGGQNSLKNLRASPFNKYLSNETTFSPIHLD
jgi:hypothetical protein